MHQCLKDVSLFFELLFHFWFFFLFAYVLHCYFAFYSSFLPICLTVLTKLWGKKKTFLCKVYCPRCILAFYFSLKIYKKVTLQKTKPHKQISNYANKILWDTYTLPNGKQMFFLKFGGRTSNSFFVWCIVVGKHN